MPQPLMLKNVKLSGSMMTYNLLELTHKKCPFHFRVLKVKIGRQEIPGVTGKFSFGVQNEAGEKLTVFPREHTGHSKHPLPTTQEMTLHMDIIRWSVPKSS